MLEKLNAIPSKVVESIKDTVNEVALKRFKETSPIKSTMEVIENTSLESLKAQHEYLSKIIKEEKVDQIEKNREDGRNREDKAYEDLKKEYPEDQGYKIEREQYLRDNSGNIVKDPETGEARRIDFMVTKDGKVVNSAEVTSETAPKDVQTAKEERIRDVGGNYIRDRETGQLIEMEKDVQTEIRRYP